MLHDQAVWTTQEAGDLYQIDGWSKGYFSVGPEGNLLVHPTKDPARSIDLKKLVDTLEARGVDSPVLIRFGDLLQHRVNEIHQAFQRAIAEYEYDGEYRLVYPIKVNQQRQVVEEILEYGAPFRFGLEAGSKPELLAVMAIASNDIPILCNGFKDDEFIKAVTLARKIGRQIIPIVEKYSELDLILQHAREHEVEPILGVRVRLAARGAGRWKSSGGLRSKFGLSVSEALKVVDRLREEGLENSLQLLHFHLGSQITNIRQIKSAINEAGRVYVELHRGGSGLRYLDVGGGLGVDYDGSQTNYESSVNYTLQEYANDVIYHVGQICNEAGIPHPAIFSESGRAVVAYHSMLVFNVLGATDRQDENDTFPESLPKDFAQPVRDLKGVFDGINQKNVLEFFHDAQVELDTVFNLFATGHVTLEQRGYAERLFWAICRKAQRIIQDLDYVPEDLQGLEAMLAETYFCNFSLFQSMPDSWAIKQLFPIAPIHRLNERPTRHAVLGDITCDSDGKVEHFIDLRDVRHTLPLHVFTGEPYYLGAFLLGAYQEILGDLHNLFGDTNAVHVRLGDAGEVIVDSVIKGDSVAEVLKYVQFEAETLIHQLRKDVEAGVRAGLLSDKHAGDLMKFYEAGLRGYTYLETPSGD